jgi:FkbM family methyltransferase
MTVIDVGANWGYFSLIAAQLVGPSGCVVSLEPDCRMYAALQENLAQNQFSHVRIFPFAAAAEACTLKLEPYDNRSNNWGVSRLILNDTRTTGTDVQCYPLDWLLNREGVTTADLIKIDVEGAEEKVLQGMRNGLSAHRYRRILLELHPTLLQNPEQAIRNIICSLSLCGYAGYWIDHSAAITRRMSYGRSVRVSDILLPLEARAGYDPWPHMMWLAPTLAL